MKIFKKYLNNMCIVSKPAILANTNIFVCAVNDRRAIIGYSAHVENKHKNNFMIIAVNNPGSVNLMAPNAIERAMGIEQPDIFHRSKQCTPIPPFQKSTRSRGSNSSTPKERYIPITDIGDYRASIVMSLFMLAKLDKSEFDVDDDMIVKLTEEYGETDDIGFIVFKLNEKAEMFSPFFYMTDIVDSIRIPTFHYHGHKTRAVVGDWDHNIVCINTEPIPEITAYEHDGNFPTKSMAFFGLGKFDLINMRSHKIKGHYANRDIFVFPDFTNKSVFDEEDYIEENFDDNDIFKKRTITVSYDGETFKPTPDYSNHKCDYPFATFDLDILKCFDNAGNCSMIENFDWSPDKINELISNLELDDNFWSDYELWSTARATKVSARATKVSTGAAEEIYD